MFLYITGSREGACLATSGMTVGGTRASVSAGAWSGELATNHAASEARA